MNKLVLITCQAVMIRYANIVTDWLHNCVVKII